MRLFPIVVLVSLLLASCGTVEFYTQAVSGQAEVMIKQQQVDRVLADPATSDALSKKLELTKRLLAFAEKDLDMPSGGAYSLYADMGRPHLVWVVHAAPELSLEAKSWWYPVVGRQTYRGYFHKELADAEIARLRRDGYETSCDGIDAFSTLGMFRDPLLNTFMDRDEMGIADLLFHELSHRKYHISGNTKFNEGMAEAVARESVRRWYRATGRPREVAEYDLRLKRLAQARAAIGVTVVNLKKLYASDLPDAVKRERKAVEIAKLKKSFVGLRGEWGGGLTSWIKEPITNAKLNSFTTYEDEVPRFTKLLDDCGGDFPTFWNEVRKLKK